MKKLDKEESYKALLDGFVELLGDKYKNFLEEYGRKVFEQGYILGEEWANGCIAKNSRFAMKYEMFEQGIISKDKIDEM